MSDEKLRETLAEALSYWYPDSGTGQAHTQEEHLEAADALLPLIAADRERHARERAAEAVMPFRELFNGGPDTACRTTWRADPTVPKWCAVSIEYCEVPMADLRDAFARAEPPSSEATP